MVWVLRRSKIKLLADAFSLSQFQKEHSWIWYHIPDFWVISKQLRILDLNLPFNNCGCGTYIVYYIACLTDRSWETERIVARLPPHAKIFLCLKWRFIYIIQFAKAIWSHGGHIWLFWPHFGSKNELFTESPFELPKRAILSEME